MKVAYFDCQFGAAGDMLNATLMDCTGSRDKWLAEIKKIALPQDSFSVSLKPVNRCGIKATYLAVEAKDTSTSRHYSEIKEIIARSDLSASVKKLSASIFEKLAKAEAAVHGTTLDQVHFHEVGAIDAIVDIVGFAIAYDLAAIEESTVSPLPLGSGQTRTEHGLYPVPPPAVLEIIAASKAPTATSSIPFECLTPTGAAILTTIAGRYAPMPAMTEIKGIGYGAGTKDPGEWPNVSRVVIGETATESGRFTCQTIAVVEANLDDIQPQVLAYACNKLWQEGALDVTLTPSLFKKGRTGNILKVLCQARDAYRFQEIILEETTSLGVRSYLSERLVLNRCLRRVEMPEGGYIRIKVSTDCQGEVMNVLPEYEDCARYAELHDIPLKKVMEAAVAEFRSAGAPGLPPGDIRSASA